jgi:hypothetical protein
MYVFTDRVKSGVLFNIRPQAGCIRAFWCKMMGIIAHILFIMKDISVISFKHDEGTNILQ